MATLADFSNMMNQKLAKKKPSKTKENQESPWIHIEKKGGK